VSKLGGFEFQAAFRERHRFNPGQNIYLHPKPGMLHIFDFASEKRLM
jgi:multiple sugar transport system ATP-binding protein